ncbi:MAG: TIGR03936 family radical SAM-associated protein [Clostridia bacterium]
MTVIRIKFKKDDSVKFISHLDMMKAFQRAIRRAGLHAGYSMGYNPQMQMVFGLPISLGFTSVAEYADFSFEEAYTPELMIDRLNNVLPAGLLVLDAGMRETQKNIMADIMFAEYEFILETSLEQEDIVEGIMGAKRLEVQKTRKGRSKMIDIRPLILKAEKRDGLIRVLVSAGNENNLNPRLAVEAVARHMDPSAIGRRYHRLGQYVERGGEMIDPLDDKALKTI